MSCYEEILVLLMNTPPHSHCTDICQNQEAPVTAIESSWKGHLYNIMICTYYGVDLMRQSVERPSLLVSTKDDKLQLSSMSSMCREWAPASCDKGLGPYVMGAV